jgi:hypothetical protein
MRVRHLCSLAFAALTVPTLVLAAQGVVHRTSLTSELPPVRPLRVLVTVSPAAPRPACDACANWMACEGGLHAAGASVQTVALKNGVMRIYTADTPSHARLVQALLARRDESLRALDAGGETVRLCPACRMARGAALSGKMVRQVVPVEGGCITITTSSDTSVVSMIRSRAAALLPGRLPPGPGAPGRPRY